MSTKSFENFIAECDYSGLVVSDDVIECVELNNHFVLIHHCDIDQFLVAVFIKSTATSKGDFEGHPRIETDDYPTAFEVFLSTLNNLK